LLPDFRSGSFIMCPGIAEIIILVGIVGIGDLFAETFGYGIVTLRIVGLHIGGTHLHLRTHGAENIDFRLALFIRGRKYTAIPFDSRSQRKSHTRIAGGPLNNRTARLYKALLFSIFNHLKSNSIFYTLTRVKIFYFY